MPIAKNIPMNGNSVYLFNQYLTAGEYMFLINAPFNTQMIVSPVNPIPGLRFIDQDPVPNVFNANLVVPQDGQYGFKVTLDRAVAEGALEVNIIRQTGAGSGSGSGSGSGGTNSEIKLWNRPDVQDFISAWLHGKKLNKWGYPDTPGVIQGTPQGYHGHFDNTFHWVYLQNPSLRDAIRQRFPQYA